MPPAFSISFFYAPTLWRLTNYVKNRKMKKFFQLEIGEVFFLYWANSIEPYCDYATYKKTSKSEAKCTAITSNHRDHNVGASRFIGSNLNTIQDVSVFLYP